MKTPCIRFSAAIVASLLALPCAADTIEEVEKKLVEKTEKAKSMSFKMKTDTNMDMPGMKMKQQGESVCEYVRKGDLWLSRVESKSKIEQEAAGTAHKSDTTSLIVADGEFVWMLNEGDNMKSAMKMKYDKQTAANPMDIKGFFQEQRKTYDIKLLADEKVDGKDCWVIEMTPKPGKAEEATNEMMGKNVTHYEKSTGMALKAVTHDKAGKPITTATFSDVKMNPDIKEERFKFKVPEGVQVMDMTAMGGAEAKPEEAKPAKP